MTVPERIRQLIKTFDYNLDSYKRGSYNETQVRREFIDPFFEELGWDVTNRQGYAEAYKDVIHEDAIKVGGATKAPDYCFRIGGTRKFFLEAKKPSVNIQGDVHPAFQLRRYGWSAKLPLSILTDFEEFAVYDCRVKPSKTDKVSHSRIMYCTYRDYEEQWDDIAGIFSREAILKGSFDKYVEAGKTKRGTTEVDAAFLQEIERWREFLARNIALRNPGLSQREMNFAVQQTIDRIVFLRICEDRGIEPYGALMALRSGQNVYDRLFQLFQRADEKYNSGLFHFKKEKGRENYDTLTTRLLVDDKPLKDIFSNLYYPDSPYEFSVLSADILGQIYEKFLGKVIRLTSSHQAKIEEKPEVRKAGGVYYTPVYIVDYIVKNTVGKLVEGKRPGPRGGVSNLRILDPACGSGSFLIGAYQYLLDWHRDAYIEDGPEKWATGKTPRLYQSHKGEWRLTTDERKRILLNNIYGVDIDHQAVNVTRLSLLLKVLEGEDEQSIGKQISMFRQRVLPDLSDNIKCGNSLIGPDFYDNRQTGLFDEEEIYRINAFDWNAEFPDIMKNGGFDAGIGNPPYVLVGSDKSEEQFYYNKKYDLTSYKTNTYILFLDRGLNLLGKNSCILGYIIPKSLVFNTFFAETRVKLLKNYLIQELVEIKEKVFRGAEVGDSLLFFAQKSSNPGENTLNYLKVKNVHPQLEIIEKFKSKQSDLSNDPDGYFYASKISIKAPTSRLADVLIVSNGINPGNIRHVLFSDSKNSEKHKKMVLGRDIQRYFLTWSGTWVNYDPNLKNTVTVSDIKSKKGMTAQTRVDFALRKPEIFTSNKILIRKTADRIIACLDLDGYYIDSLAYSVQLRSNTVVSIYYILGLLNSLLLDFIHGSYSQNKNKVFAKVLGENIKKLPIRTINFDDPADAASHDRMVDLVNRMLDLNKRLAETGVPQTREMLKRRIETTDRQIDALVYELYGLNEEEIKIVEGETA